MDHSEKQTEALPTPGSLDPAEPPGIPSAVRNPEAGLKPQSILTEEEQHYRILFESAGDGIIVMRGDQCVDCNQKALELFGYSREQFLGKRPSEFSPPRQPDGRDSQEVAKEINRQVAEGKTVQFEWQHCRSDGTLFDVQVTLNPLKIGGVPHQLCLARDITEHKRAKEALRQKSEEMDRFFDLSLDLLAICAMDGHFQRLNLAWESTLGYSREELLARHYSDFIHPDDLAATQEAMTALAGQQKVVGFINRYRARDGRDHWLEWQGAPAGNVIYAAARDITERRQAELALREREERFRTVFEEGPFGISLVGLDGKIIRANSKLCAIYGYTEEELRQHKITDFTHPDEMAAHLKMSGQIFRGEISSFRLERRFIRKDGGIIWTDLMVSLVRGADRKPLYTLGMVQDITESRRTAQALQQSEARLSLVVSQLPAILWSTDLEMRFTSHLGAGLRPLGIVSNQLVGATWEDYLKRVDFQEDRPDPRRALAGESLNYEAVIEGRNYDVHVEPLRNAAGEITGTVGIALDITSRKGAANALRESEERFRATFEDAGIGMALVDLRGHPIKSNPALRQMLGYSEEELCRMGYPEFTHPEDRNLDWELFGQLMAGKLGKYAIEKRFFRKDGSVLWGLLTATTARDKQGRPMYVVGMVEDITERKEAEAALQQSEQRYRTLFENAPVGIYRTTPDGRILAANPALVRMLNYASFEELANRNLNAEGFEPNYPRTQFTETMAKHGAISGFESAWTKKDGLKLQVQENVRAIRDDAGEVLFYEGTVEDITQRKSLEAQLQQAAKIEAVGRLAGGVAHDFNNLLTVINGYSEILMERFASDPKASGYLKEIYNAGERAAALTRQLLAFSRRQVMTSQVLDLNEVVSNLEKMLRRLIGEDIKLHAILDPGLGRVMADPGQVEQVIMNLAVNARDAMPLGGHLTLETRNVDLDETYTLSHSTVKPGPHVMLAVGDTGVGMSPETKSQIFEPFFTTKEMGKGTGLGLATVYGIIKQSGGSIWVYSEPNQGTVFKIYFPLVTEDAKSMEPAAQPPDSASGTETILVVEDEEGVRSLVRLALLSGGYQVLEVPDARSALATCANHRGNIHLLLTDVVMPQMSGPQVASEVAALRPGIKVLYMSGYTDDAVVRHGVLSQEMPFIQKPFSPLALRKKIREILGK